MIFIDPLHMAGASRHFEATHVEADESLQVLALPLEAVADALNVEAWFVDAGSIVRHHGTGRFARCAPVFAPRHPRWGLSLTTRALTTTRRDRTRPAEPGRRPPPSLGKDSLAPRPRALKRPLPFRPNRRPVVAARPADRCLDLVHKGAEVRISARCPVARTPEANTEIICGIAGHPDEIWKAIHQRQAVLTAHRGAAQRHLRWRGDGGPAVVAHCQRRRLAC
jgi:hypothetical protein